MSFAALPLEFCCITCSIDGVKTSYYAITLQLCVQLLWPEKSLSIHCWVLTSSTIILKLSRNCIVFYGILFGQNYLYSTVALRRKVKSAAVHHPDHMTVMEKLVFNSLWAPQERARNPNHTEHWCQTKYPLYMMVIIHWKINHFISFTSNVLKSQPKPSQWTSKRNHVYGRQWMSQ